MTEPERIDDVDEFLKFARVDFLTFARGIVIPSALGERTMDDAMREYEEKSAFPFQREFFERVAPSLHAVRDGKVPPIRRFWLERTKGASKDTDIAICLLWLLAFPVRPLLMPISAANQQQAGIVRGRANDILHYNEWLNDFVEIQQNRLLSKELRQNGKPLAEARIEATGSSSARQGDVPDVLVLNELVHVERWRVNETHMNNADKVPRGLVIIATNAGILGTPAKRWRDEFSKNPRRWSFHVWLGVAPWISEEDVAEARKRDPIGAEFARLWLGRWISGRGGAVSDESVEACFRLPGPILAPEPGWLYLAGLDLGVSHDHAGLSVLGVHAESQRIVVARAKGWVPSVLMTEGKLEVDLIDVERTCLEWWKLYGFAWFGYDPASGGSLMAQHLRREGVPMQEMTFSSPSNCTAMARAFVMLIEGRRLECHDDAEGRLRRDFGKFSIVHRPPSNYKLEAVSDEEGHADVGTAVLICLPKTVELIGGDLFVGSDVYFHEPGEMETVERVAELRAADPDLSELLSWVEREDMYPPGEFRDFPEL